jgi:hypothetical protein
LAASVPYAPLGSGPPGGGPATLESCSGGRSGVGVHVEGGGVQPVGGVEPAGGVQPVGGGVSVPLDAAPAAATRADRRRRRILQMTITATVRTIRTAS